MKTLTTLKIRLSASDWLLEIVSFLILTSGMLYSFVSYSSLPPRIPIHFNFSGQADRFGNKEDLLFMIFVNLLIYVFFALASKYPRLINYPFEIKVQNQERHLKNAMLMLRLTKLFVIVILAVLNYDTVQIGLGKQSKLSTFFIPTVALGLVSIIAYFIRRGYLINKRSLEN